MTIFSYLSLDLISDEATNTSLLRWLRRWDPAVFQRAAPPIAAVASANEVTDDSKRSWEKSQVCRSRVLTIAGRKGNRHRDTVSHILFSL